MANENIPYKIYLTEDEMPRTWYNVRADMKVKPAPLRSPATGAPMTFDDLRPVFCDELIRQELDNDDREIPIPDEIRDFYKMYRPSPLARASTAAASSFAIASEMLQVQTCFFSGTPPFDCQSRTAFSTARESSSRFILIY